MGLADIFGCNNPTAKVIDFFRVNIFWDYSLNDVRNETDVSYRTLQKVVPYLATLGILKYTRTEGKAKLYMFNKGNETAKQLQNIAISNDYHAALAEHGAKDGIKSIAYSCSEGSHKVDRHQILSVKVPA